MKPLQSRCLFSNPINSLTLTGSRTHSTLSSVKTGCYCLSIASSRQPSIAYYSSEVDKEVAAFLEKEIQFETSKTSDSLPKIPGFEILAEGGDLTLTKSAGSEKIVVKLSVNGAVDSMLAENPSDKQDEPPQMVCRPPFEVEISKGSGPVLALQCAFPQIDEGFEDTDQYAKEGQEDKLDDQFEIQEVALHDGEWKDQTYSVTAPTMDAELYDLLMDTLDERGINDEFISQMVDYCTAYEMKQYVGFLKGLKSFAEK